MIPTFAVYPLLRGFRCGHNFMQKTSSSVHTALCKKGSSTVRSRHSHLQNCTCRRRSSENRCALWPVLVRVQLFVKNPSWDSSNSRAIWRGLPHGHRSAAYGIFIGCVHRNPMPGGITGLRCSWGK
jgi:hypothetical protein